MLVRLLIDPCVFPSNHWSFLHWLPWGQVFRGLCLPWEHYGSMDVLVYHTTQGWLTQDMWVLPVAGWILPVDLLLHKLLWPVQLCQSLWFSRDGKSCFFSSSSHRRNVHRGGPGQVFLFLNHTLRKSIGMRRYSEQPATTKTLTVYC